MTDPKPPSSPPPKQISFHYIKSNAFRVAHADGVIGGLTPMGQIHCAVYSERPALPQLIAQKISEDGQLGDVINQEGREGIVREIEFDFVMTKHVAEAFRDWLTKHIEELDDAMERQAEKSKGNP